MEYEKFLARVRCYHDDEKPAPVDRAGCLPEVYALAESAIRRRDGFWFAILCGVGALLAGSGIGIYMGVGHVTAENFDSDDRIAVIAIISSFLGTGLLLAMDLHVKDQFLIRTAYEDYLNDTEKYKLVLSTSEIERLQERIERSNRSQLAWAVLGVLSSPFVAALLPIVVLLSCCVLLVQTIVRTQLVKDTLDKWWILLAKGWNVFSSDVPS